MERSAVNGASSPVRRLGHLPPGNDRKTKYVLNFENIAGSNYKVTDFIYGSVKKITYFWNANIDSNILVSRCEYFLLCLNSRIWYLSVCWTPDVFPFGQVSGQAAYNTIHWPQHKWVLLGNVGIVYIHGLKANILVYTPSVRSLEPEQLDGTV